MASETAEPMMINITVKTLDGQNRTFSVPDHFNVQQLKERISSSVEISADKQRLIYQGRVMQDNQILKSYDIHGKVIHLVQRAPPTTLSSSSTTDSTTTSTSSTPRPQIQLDGNLLNVQINLGRVQGTPTTNEARARVRQAEFNLRIINDALSQLLCLPPRPEDPTAADGQESPSSGHASRPVPAAAPANFSENRTDTPAADQPRPPSQETSDQQVGLTAVELASFLDQVLDTQARVLSRIRQYQDLLRNEENYPPNSTEAQNAQEVVNRVTEIFHALGHMMHSLSDVTVNMSTSVPRQAMANSLTPFQIPGAPGGATPIHVNVQSRQDNRNRQRPRQQTATTAATASDSTTTSAANAVPSTNASAAPGVNTTTETTSHTSVSSTFQPLAQNITQPGDSGVTVGLFPTTVTVHDVRTVVSQGQDADSTSDSDSSSSDSDDAATTTVIRRNIITRSPLNQPAAATSAAPSNTTPSTAASSPPQRPGTTTYTSSTSTSSTITFGGGLDGAHLPAGSLPQVPGLPSGFLQNIFGSLLNTHGAFPGQSVQVNVVQETTTETGPENQQHPRQQQPSGPDRPRPCSREHLNQQRSPAAGIEAPSKENASPKSKAQQATSTAAAPIGKTNSTTTNTSPASTTSSSTSTANSHSVPTQRANLGSRIHPNLGPHGRPANMPRPYLFNLGPTGPTRQQRVPPRSQPAESLLPLLLSQGSQGYVDPYLPCNSTQYTSQIAQAAARSLQGQARPQQIPNLSAMVSGMVGDILGQASQQAAHVGPRTSAGTNSTSTGNPSRGTTPNSTTAGATTTSTASGQPTTVHNPIELLSQLLGATGGAGQVGSVPAELGAMMGSLMQAFTGTPAAPPTTRGSATTTAPTLTMADLLSQVRSVRTDGSSDTSVMSSILETISPHIGLTDLFSLVMGNGQVLTQVRQPLQDLVTSLVGQHGSVQQLVQVVLNDVSSDIKHLQDLAVVKDGVDIASSVNNCLRTHLLALFTYIHPGNTGPVGNFGARLYAQWTRMLAELISVCVYCMRDGYPGFLGVLQQCIPRVTQEMNSAFTSWMAVAMQSFLESFYNNHPIPESDIIGYIVSKSDMTTPTVPSSQDQNQPKPQTSTNGPADVIHPSASAVNHAHLSGVLSQPTADSPDSQLPTVNAPTLAQDSEAHKPLDAAPEAPASHQPPIAHPSTLATQVTHTAAALDGRAGVKDSDEWQSVVPQEWIPVISQDIERQQEQRPQPPFSDAYLQGLPAKRRRMMSLEHSHGMGNMPQYLPDSIKRAARTADAKPISSEDNLAHEAAENVDLQAELEKEITEILEARINSDQDFSLDRFPNAEHYFHRPKQ